MTSNVMEANTFKVDWVEFKNEAVKLIKWDGSTSIIIIVITAVIGITGVVCKGLIVNYVIKYAPRERPINTFTLLEQVRTLKIFNWYILVIIAFLS